MISPASPLFYLSSKIIEKAASGGFDLAGWWRLEGYTQQQVLAQVVLLEETGILSFQEPGRWVLSEQYLAELAAPNNLAEDIPRGPGNNAPHSCTKRQ
ncbi:MAG: hypothetical protein NWF14_02590 [Candidatus Bathyarchaeota archaeon]|nr:hypothetical protein [Candidatus Bathyarchaeota archaeon]